MTIPAGTTIDERVEIECLIGHGGMGVVYRGRQLGLDRPVAVKFLTSLAGSEQEWRLRFDREAQLLCELHHRDIPSFYGYGIFQDTPYMIVELVHGESLEDILERGGALPQQTAVVLLKRLCGALEYAHMRGVIHRDIKPGNIIMLEDGGVKLIDFGLAKRSRGNSQQALTEAGAAVGSVLYMSPEQCIGIECTAQSDIYSLGCVMYHMLTGSPPFDNDSVVTVMHRQVSEDVGDLTAINPNLRNADSLQAVLAKCMSKNPLNRFNDMTELSRAFSILEQDGCIAPDRRVANSGIRPGLNSLAAQINGRPEHRALRWKVMFAVTAAIVICGVSAAFCLRYLRSAASPEPAAQPTPGVYTSGINRDADYWLDMARTAAKRRNLALCESALAKFSDCKNCDDWSPEAGVLSILGEDLLGAGRSDEALPVFQHLESLEAAHRPNSLRHAVALSKVAQVLNFDHRPMDEQRPYFVKSRNIIEGHPDDASDQSARCAALIALGSFELRDHHPRLAEVHLREGVNLLERITDRQKGMLYVAKLRLGRAALQSDHEKEGCEVLNQAFRGFQSRAEWLLCWHCLDAPITWYLQHNQLDKARSYLDQGHEVAAAIDNPIYRDCVQAYLSSLWAEYYFKHGNASEAQTSSLSALEAYEKMSFSGIQNLGDYEYSQAAQIRRSVLHQILSSIYKKQGKTEQAQRELQQAEQLAARYHFALAGLGP